VSGSTQEIRGIIEETRKTKQTAARLANGEYPKDADHIRVLAGMIQQLAGQIERLAGAAVEGDDGAEPSTGSAAGMQAGAKEAEAAVEEDQTPEDAPADPISDRT
jgi:hypothetical protein